MIPREPITAGRTGQQPGCRLPRSTAGNGPTSGRLTGERALLQSNSRMSRIAALLAEVFSDADRPGTLGPHRRVAAASRSAVPGLAAHDSVCDRQRLRDPRPLRGHGALHGSGLAGAGRGRLDPDGHGQRAGLPAVRRYHDDLAEQSGPRSQLGPDAGNRGIVPGAALSRRLDWSRQYRPEPDRCLASPGPGQSSSS